MKFWCKDELEAWLVCCCFIGVGGRLAQVDTFTAGFTCRMLLCIRACSCEIAIQPHAV
jgi:hypothetical protein